MIGHFARIRSESSTAASTNCAGPSADVRVGCGESSLSAVMVSSTLGIDCDTFMSCPGASAEGNSAADTVGAPSTGTPSTGTVSVLLGVDSGRASLTAVIGSEEYNGSDACGNVENVPCTENGTGFGANASDLPVSDGLSGSCARVAGASDCANVAGCRPAEVPGTPAYAFVSGVCDCAAVTGGND